MSRILQSPIFRQFRAAAKGELVLDSIRGCLNLWAVTKRHILLTLAILVIVTGGFGIVAWLIPSDQPSYQGRPLSGWLDILARRNRQPEAFAAVRAIGTNALPYLMQHLTSYKPNSHRKSIFNKINRLFGDTLLADKTVVDLAEFRLIGVLGAFDALGPIASNSIPSLTLLLKRSDPVSVVAGKALGLIGPVALPVLVSAMTNQDTTVQYNAYIGVVLMGKINSTNNIGMALPVILNWLHRTNSLEGVRRHNAILALPYMRGQAAEVLPVLTNIMTNFDFDERVMTLDCIRSAGATARFTIPVLTHALSDSDPAIRELATNVLRKIDPAYEARP